MPPAGVEFQAQIDVVERDGKIHFVETAHCFELVPSDDQTRGSYGTDALGQTVAVEIAWIIIAQVSVRVGGASAYARDDPRMLHRSIGIDQATPDRPDAGSSSMLHH
jgi:hypothetical protein